MQDGSDGKGVLGAPRGTLDGGFWRIVPEHFVGSKSAFGPNGSYICENSGLRLISSPGKYALYYDSVSMHVSPKNNGNPCVELTIWHSSVVEAMQVQSDPL